MMELWRQLAAGGADVALSGHDHHYERFAPLDARGRPDPVGGMRQFVVGTGGGGVYRIEARRTAQRSTGKRELRCAETGASARAVMNGRSLRWKAVVHR